MVRSVLTAPRLRFICGFCPVKGMFWSLQGDALHLSLNQLGLELFVDESFSLSTQEDMQSRFNIFLDFREECSRLGL